MGSPVLGQRNSCKDRDTIDVGSDQYVHGRRQLVAGARHGDHFGQDRREAAAAELTDLGMMRALKRGVTLSSA
ncbi:MAG: hypothetical protein ACSLE6_00910 [Mycobacterium sp.]